MLQLRTMTLADVPLGMYLKAQAGWNQTQDDWRRFLTLAPDDCFVARCDGRDAGTVACFTFGPVAWIAMVLVDVSMRGRGLGTALMRHALDHLDSRGVASIRLDATPLGRPIYEKLGFVAQFELSRHEGIVRTDGLPQPSVPSAQDHLTIRPAGHGELPALIELDAAATATERGPLLRALYEQHPNNCRLACRAGRIVGYAMTRPGANAAQIGPLIAGGGAGPGAALLVDALRRYAGHRVFVDVPDDHAAATAIVRSAGLTVQRPFTRMCRGAQVHEDINQLWISSGPEKG